MSVLTRGPLNSFPILHGRQNYQKDSWDQGQCKILLTILRGGGHLVRSDQSPPAPAMIKAVQTPCTVVAGSSCGSARDALVITLHLLPPPLLLSLLWGSGQDFLTGSRSA